MCQSFIACKGFLLPKADGGSCWLQRATWRCSVGGDLVYAVDSNMIRPGPLPHPLPQGEGRASTATGCCAAPSPLWGGLGWGPERKSSHRFRQGPHLVGCVLVRTSLTVSGGRGPLIFRLRLVDRVKLRAFRSSPGTTRRGPYEAIGLLFLGPWHQGINVAGEVSVGQFREPVAQIGIGLDAIHLAG